MFNFNDTKNPGYVKKVFCTNFFPIAPSSPPLSFEALVFNATAIMFSWDPPPQHHQNGIIRRYVVALNPGVIGSYIMTFTTQTVVIVTNLHPFTLYQSTVAAETIAVGVETDIILARTHEAGINS